MERSRHQDRGAQWTQACTRSQRQKAVWVTGKEAETNGRWLAELATGEKNPESHSQEQKAGLLESRR